MIEKFSLGFMVFLNNINTINTAPFIAVMFMTIVVFFIRNIIIYLCK